jgi:hypothetical protein
MAALILCLPLLVFTVLATLLPPWLPEPAPAAAPDATPSLQPRMALPQGAFAPGGERGSYFIGLPDASPRKRYVPLKLAVAALLGTMAALLFAVLTQPGEPRLLELPGSRPEPVLVTPYRSVFAAPLVARITEPIGGSWVEPLDVTLLGDRVFVLDHAGEQIVETDLEGRFVTLFNAQNVPGLALHHPHAMVTDGSDIYVGNTFPPRVYVLDVAASRLKRSIVLPPGEIEGLPAVPTGMALTAAGTLIISDGQNHRLIEVQRDGTPVRVINRPSGSWDLFQPGNLNIAPDTAAATIGQIAVTGRPGSVGVTADGTILALDVLGAGVVRLKPDGTIASVFARPGDPVGGVFEPSDIAVDANGRIFIADELIRGIQVYDAAGVSLGLLGRSDPNTFNEAADVMRPSALAIQGDSLWVVDRGRGLVRFALPPPEWPVAP